MAAVLAALSDPKATKKALAELVGAEKAANAATEQAEAAERKATDREKAAQAAEADATRACQALADETEKARDELHKRFTAVSGRERVAGEVEKSQDARDADLKRREEHLSKAGVRGF